MNHLQGVAGDIGRGITLITPDGERTFAIAPGDMDELNEDHIPEDIIAGASAFVTCAYPIRHHGKPIQKALTLSLEYAKQHHIPVVMSLGTKHLVDENRQQLMDIINKYVDILAMNELEAEALTGHSDPLLAADSALEFVDMVLLTAGPSGLYLCGYTDDELKEKPQIQ
ncbi:PfkB family carbohydrate kinase [Marinomonas phaeophyticola]|uniref:PfkB family carbohydrate kinase n=1 Tax=Marinomonas phaeophyticola TaxID=3004091 RepID=UPI003204A6D5